MTTITSLQAENARLTRWVLDLQSGAYVNCVYCGHRYGPAAGENAVPTAMADVLKLHIAVCPKHPMSGLLKACRSADDVIAELKEARSASPANRIDDLLDQLQAEIRKAIQDASGGPRAAGGDRRDELDTKYFKDSS